jgi:hypothetical protein
MSEPTKNVRTRANDPVYRPNGVDVRFRKCLGCGRIQGEWGEDTGGRCERCRSETEMLVPISEATDRAQSYWRDAYLHSEKWRIFWWVMWLVMCCVAAAGWGTRG